jgi:hypothetical protein
MTINMLGQRQPWQRDRDVTSNDWMVRKNGWILPRVNLLQLVGVHPVIVLESNYCRWLEFTAYRLHGAQLRVQRPGISSSHV